MRESATDADLDVDTSPPYHYQYQYPYNDNRVDPRPVRSADEHPSSSLRTAQRPRQAQRSGEVWTSNPITDAAALRVKRQQSVTFSNPPSPPPGAGGGRAGCMTATTTGTPRWAGEARDYKTQTQEGGVASRRVGGSSTRGGRGGGEGGGSGSGRVSGDRDGDGEQEGMARRPPGFSWKKVAENYGTIELDNKGSVARDHLALGAYPFFPMMSLSIAVPYRPIPSYPFLSQPIHPSHPRPSYTTPSLSTPNSSKTNLPSPQQNAPS